MKTPQGGLPAWQSRQGPTSGHSGTPWSRLSRLSCVCQCSMFLCRCWWNSCRTSSSSLSRLCLLRAGYRCAQDHFREHPDANLASRAAAGGAVGGSANSPFFTSSSPLTLQIIKVSSQNRVQLLVCVSVEVFKVSAQDRVPQRFWTLRRSIFNCFLSHFSPAQKKSGRVAAHSSAELGAHSTSSTLSAHQMAHLDAGTTWVDGNGDANTVHAVAALRYLRFEPGPVGCRGSTVTNERHNPARQSANPAK